MLEIDLVGPTQGRDARQKKAFRSVDITDANHQPVVHQDRFHRHPAAASRGVQPVANEVVRQRFHTQGRQGGVAIDNGAILP